MKMKKRSYLLHTHTKKEKAYSGYVSNFDGGTVKPLSLKAEIVFSKV